MSAVKQDYGLNKQQQEAVSYTDGPLLIVAGAGTGKTTVITHKIAHIVRESLAAPEEILALTFTENAAFEMQERVDQMLETGYIEMQISTFHAFCQRLLEEYGLDVGIPNQFRLLTQVDAWLLVRNNLDALNLTYYRPRGNPGRHIHELLSHFSKCKDELLSPAAYLEYAESVKLDADDANTDERSRLTEVANAYHAYNQLLLDNASLDFGDLIAYTVQLLQERPAILAALQKQFKYILVDEFQDVNWAQYQLVKLLTGEQNQLTVVGDDDQSIYAFRGASVSNILRFQEDFPKAKGIVLADNYRSGQEILDAAYTSIQNNNPDRLEEKLNIKKKLKSQTKTKASVSQLFGADGEAEVQLVLQQIAELKKTDKEMVWDDVAILVRANNHATPFIEGLEHAGIPYEYLTSAGLYRQPVVSDCIHFFRLLDNKREALSVYRMLRLPPLEISEEDIQRFTTQARKKSTPYDEALKSASAYRLSAHGVTQCLKIISLVGDAMSAMRSKKPTAILLEFLEESGYLKHLQKREAKGERAAVRSIGHLRQFFDYVHQYEIANPNADIASFMSHFEQVLEAGETGKMSQPTDTPDSVNIMTVHGSKGLEFKYVFVVNMVQDRFPSRRRGEAIQIPEPLVHEILPEGDAHIQEERRLFYVAVTRAKEQLFLTGAENYGGVRKKKQSIFLSEIGLGDAEPSSYSPSLKPNKKKQKAEQFQYELPKTFSFSQLKLFEKSPYEYKLYHILKIPQKGSRYFSFGNSMHLALQRFYDRIRTSNASEQRSLFDLTPAPERDGIEVPTLEELIELYEKAWIPDWYESKSQREQWYRDGKKMLKAWYESQEEWTVPVALEGGFRMNIGGHTVTGKIDRIDQLEDGSLHIIDYKTGKPKQKVVGVDKEQLLLYQMAAEKLPKYRNIGPIGKLTFSYLSDNSEVSFVGKEKEIVALEEKITKTIDQILATDWSQVRDDNGQH